MHEMVSIPEEFTDPLFTRLFLLAKINKFTTEEYQQYQKSLENMSEFDNIVNSTAEAAEMRGHAKGHAEGHAEGKAEGRAEGDLDRALKVAREMLADGMPVDKICKYTELSVEQIEALKASQDK